MNSFMIALNVVLGIVAACLLIGVIGETMPSKQKNLTIAFVAVLAFIVALNTVM